MRKNLTSPTTEEIYKYSYPYLLGYAAKCTEGDVARAEDLVQDAFLRVFNQVEQWHLRFDNMKLAVGYVFVTLKHVAIDYNLLRKIPVQTQRGVATLLSPEENKVVGRLSEVVREAVSLLPDSLRITTEALLLGYRVKEIPKLLGIDPKTVRSRLFRARLKLKEIIPTIDPETFALFDLV